jgi:quercetin dioxygenase-like cupin family protein
MDGGNMEKLGKHIVATGIATALAAWPLVAGPAQATPASGFTAVQQYKGDFGRIEVKAKGAGDWEVELKTDGQSDVHVVRNSIAVGGQSGWHRHPGPSLITVTVGEITAYESSDPLCSPRVYRAGEGFVDDGDHAHLLKNESGAAAETVAVQFLSDGSTRRIDVPQPNNCNF